MNERTLTVKGIGNISAKPDLIIITLTLATTTPDYAKTNELAALELETLRKAIVSCGHEGQSLKTTNFNIRTENESYRDEAGNYRYKFKGYSCIHSLKLEFGFDMKMLGETLAAISSSGTNPQFQISFSVKDENAVQAELLENAIINATEKAAVLAKSSGVKLGDIKHINYSWGEIHLSSETCFNDSLVCESRLMPMNIDIEPEDVKASDTVTVIWEIK